MRARTRKILNAAVAAAATAAMIAATATSCLRGLSAKSDPRSSEKAVEDLNDYTSASRLQRCRYEHYAERASADGNRTAAGLFNALARSERIHENACIRAIGLLKGQCRPQESEAVEVADTKSNLRRSLDEERMRYEASFGTAIESAIESGNYYTARILIWVEGTNRRHIELLERCIDAADSNEKCDGCEYSVCPVCGNIYEATSCDRYCPLCRTCRSEFESFGRLQVNQTVADGVDD